MMLKYVVCINQRLVRKCSRVRHTLRNASDGKLLDSRVNVNGKLPVFLLKTQLPLQFYTEYVARVLYTKFDPTHFNRRSAG